MPKAGYGDESQIPAGHGDDSQAPAGRGSGRSDAADSGDDSASTQSQRVDKWLWHARVVKTRALAAKLVKAGHVRRNREPLKKSSDLVRLGDVLTIALPSRVVVWKILGCSDRRGPAPEAATLYQDLTVRGGQGG
ncbi:MAG: RNA-binding S4 domain-containing protein [Ancalomicrobiaceae bacterium]|nr:RNA-binding S4 domain-containing protein [Ancalomicrobiaceae bacterium]